MWAHVCVHMWMQGNCCDGVALSSCCPRAPCFATVLCVLSVLLQHPCGVTSHALDCWWCVLQPPTRPVGIHIREARTALVNEFMASMPPRACANCQAIAVSLRKEGYVKIFQKPLSKSSKAVMANLGLTFESALKADERAAAAEEKVLGGGGGGAPLHTCPTCRPITLFLEPQPSSTPHPPPHTHTPAPLGLV